MTIGADESTEGGVIVSGLEVVQAGFSVIDIASGLFFTEESNVAGGRVTPSGCLL